MTDIQFNEAKRIKNALREVEFRISDVNGDFNPDLGMLSMNTKPILEKCKSVLIEDLELRKKELETEFIKL